MSKVLGDNPFGGGEEEKPAKTAGKAAAKTAGKAAAKQGRAAQGKPARSRRKEKEKKAPQAVAGAAQPMEAEVEAAQTATDGGDPAPGAEAGGTDALGATAANACTAAEITAPAEEAAAKEAAVEEEAAMEAAAAQAAAAEAAEAAEAAAVEAAETAAVEAAQAPDAEEAQAVAEAAASPGAEAETETKTEAETETETEAETVAEAETDTVAEAEVADADGAKQPTAQASARAAPPEEEAEDSPDTVPPEEAMEDVYYGEEAAPSPGDYGPGLDTRREIPHRKSITEEVRELERRVKARLTPAFPIEQRRRVPLELVWKRYRDLAMRDRSDVVDEFGRDPIYSRKVEPLLDFVYSKYFRVAVEGSENIPELGRGIIVANHSGTLPWDGAMLMHAVRKNTQSHRDVRPLVEDFVFHFPYLGTMINRIGGVRACQENAERLLNQDQLIAVFPEGIKGIGKLYRERYRLQRFGRGGFVKLALRTSAPVVPAAIIGAEETQPMMLKVTWLAKYIGIPYIPVTPTFPLLGPLGLMPLPTKWTIRFGAPLDFGMRYGPDAVEDRILVNKLAETVRSTIQEMVDEGIAERRSILFG